MPALLWTEASLMRLELMKTVEDEEPAEKFLNVQRVITSEGCDVNGFSQSAACFSKQHQQEETEGGL